MACMIFQFLGQDSNTLSSAEEAAFAKLCATHRRLVVESGRITTKSEGGFNSCAAFLDVLASTANVLALEPTSRSYRSTFTINYRALFPDDARHYRVDILEASVEQYAAIWVNGDKFEFSAEAMRRAEVLQNSWSQLSDMLENGITKKPLRSALRQVFKTLDAAWASFEQVYITDLIGIEEKARHLIVQAIEHERRLQALELVYGKGEVLNNLPEYKQVQSLLLAAIARLNSVANYRRKGRDDLNVEVLFKADAAGRCCCDHGMRTDVKEKKAVQVLANDVLQSFEAIRVYLQEVAHCLERVDPHLCNNPGLVARLVDLEESWEIGTRYVQHDALLAAICDMVLVIQSAQSLIPALTQMCEDCDVEFFMVLPRILWLRFLMKPNVHLELLKELLPHRFKETGGDSEANCALEGSWHPELKLFLQKFNRTIALLEASQDGRVGAEHAISREVLLKRAVTGASLREHSEHLGVHLQTVETDAVEDFMHDLEKWSMEVQRHCPEDWNQCSAVLMHCLTGTVNSCKQGDFQV